MAYGYKAGTTGDGSIKFAVDVVGGWDFQRAKWTWGAEGAANDVAPGVAANANSLSVTTAKDDIKFVDVTLVLDTSAYAAGDLLVVPQIVNSAVKATDGTGVLHSIMLIDEDDNGSALTLYFANASSSFGTINLAPSISDANARTILGFVDIAAADYKDLGGVKVAFKGNIGMTIAPASGTDDIYVAAVLTAGTPTYTASGIKLRLGFLS
jgi:hypothetical protein